MSIYEKLRNSGPAKHEIIIMSLWNFKGIPSYGEMYIRPAYELVYSTETLIELVQHFLVEYSETDNEAKQVCIEKIIFPMFKSLTGHNYDTNYFKAIL